MPVSKKLKEAVLQNLLRREPLMDTEDIQKRFLMWLEQFRYPGFPEGSNWAEAIKVFPAEPGDDEADSGICIRFMVRLHFSKNKYYISLMESLNPESRNVYFLTCHVNWDPVEYKLCKLIAERYHRDIDESLQPRHNIWAQHFKPYSLHDGLNACAAAIMGHEMGSKYQPMKKPQGHIIKSFFPRRLDLPDKERE